MFTLAIAITSWYAGLWPTLLVCLLTLPMGIYFASPDHQSLHFGMDDTISFASFALIGGVLLAFGESHRRAQRQMQKDAIDRERSEAMAHDREASFRATFDRAGLGMAECDGESHCFLHVNRRLEELTGYSEEELQRVTFLELAYPEDREEAGLIFMKAVASGQPQCEFEKRYVRKDGSVRWAYVNVAFVRNSGGDLLRSLTTVVDVQERHQAEEARHEAERHLRLALQSLPISVFTQDRDLRYTIVHNSAPGVPAEQMLGRTDEEFLPPIPGRAEVLAAKHRALIEGVAVRESIAFGAGRTARFFDVTVEPIRNQAGQITGLASASLDTTETRRRAMDREMLMRLTDQILRLRETDAVLDTTVRVLGEYLNASRCLYYEVDPERGLSICRNEYVNGVGSALGEYPISLIGALMLETAQRGETVVIGNIQTDARLTPAERASLATLEVGAVVSVPFVKDGTLVARFSVQSATPCEWDEETVQLVRTVAQRTWESVGRAQAEARLRELNANLEAKVAERTAALQEANAEMEGFTYSISHDLNIPIRTVIAQSRILMLDHGDQVNDDARGAIRRLEAAGQKLKALTEDLLSYIRLGRREVNRSEVDLTAVARGVAEDLRTHSELQVTIQPDLCVQGDRHLLELALYNLLGNAVKYRKPGTVAHAEIGAENVHGETVYFVRDEGIGFEPVYAEKIFEPFQRLHRDTEYLGTGIGLANVRRVVERHGGRIWAEGDPNQGATFRFTLPNHSD